MNSQLHLLSGRAPKISAGPIFCRSTLCLLLFGVLLAPRAARAQSFTVTDPTLSGSTYLWTPLTLAGSGGTNMSDPTIDQQTGQLADDLVGSAATPGFFMRYGQINGVNSVAFRFVEN